MPGRNYPFVGGSEGDERRPAVSDWNGRERRSCAQQRRAPTALTVGAVRGEDVEVDGFGDSVSVDDVAVDDVAVDDGVNDPCRRVCAVNPIAT